MSRGFPSMTALLGLIAVAGYQNRDKLAEMFGGSGSNDPRNVDRGRAGQPGSQGSGGLGDMLGGGSGGLGGLLGGGLGELNQHMRQNGRGDAMDSWVGTGPNQDVQPHDLEAALGPDVLEDLTETTGLSRQEILQRLSRELPHAVDEYTPQGRLPQSHEF